MKITPSDHQHQTAVQPKIPDHRDQGGPDFADFLTGPSAAGPHRPAGGYASAASILESGALGLIQANRGLAEAGAADSTQTTLRQLERTLDQIDRYAAALGDLKAPLKNLAPLADDLDQSADRLSRLTRDLSESDPLKSLSTETAVLATVEAMKFRRGDYI